MFVFSGSCSMIGFGSIMVILDEFGGSQKRGKSLGLRKKHDEFYRPNRWVAHKNMVIWLIFGVTEAFGILRVDVSIKFGFSIVCFSSLAMNVNTYQPAQQKVQGTAWPIDAVLFAVQDAYTDKQLHLWDVSFSADSQQFAVATTHGTFVFSQVRMVMGWGWLGQGQSPNLSIR